MKVFVKIVILYTKWQNHKTHPLFAQDGVKYQAIETRYYIWLLSICGICNCLPHKSGNWTKKWKA